jgi:hypothetical protein
MQHSDSDSHDSFCAGKATTAAPKPRAAAHSAAGWVAVHARSGKRRSRTLRAPIVAQLRSAAVEPTPGLSPIPYRSYQGWQKRKLRSRKAK